MFHCILHSAFGFLPLTKWRRFPGCREGSAGQVYLLSGIYQSEWDASGISSGVYLYRPETERFVQTRKMILMRW